MRQSFEKEMIAYGYEPEELVIDDETGTYRDDELLAMWVGFKIGYELLWPEKDKHVRLAREALNFARDHIAADINCGPQGLGLVCIIDDALEVLPNE